MDTEKIGKQIALLRKERGYTQESLAELAGVSPQAVSKWERGHALPEAALLPPLAKALGVSIDALLTESRMRILASRFGDGIESADVTGRLNRLIENDTLSLSVTMPMLVTALNNNRPKFLTVKYQVGEDILCAFAKENEELTITPGSRGFTAAETPVIVAASYGTAKASRDVMHKIEHYKVFGWKEYRANHETFPSDPNSDEKDYLTFVYLNRDGIRMVTCEEGESIAYTADKTDFIRKKASNEHFIPGVPTLPPFGSGMECSWAAALTSALSAMNIKTTYENVMGVSGACFRLAFSSPKWDYSSVDGLVAYDYATPAYRAFGFAPRFADRVDKEKRADERRVIVDEIRHNMPVLGINLRVAAEWGVICGYRDNGASLYCRTKYDGWTLGSPDFVSGSHNKYDYLPVEHWPFIITYFGDMTLPPSPKENLISSLRVFSDCARQEKHRGYAIGLRAYEVWRDDLMNEAWYEAADNEQLARRFSVNQFCALALYDARKSAHAYLTENQTLLAGSIEEMSRLVLLFGELADTAGKIHSLIDSGEYLVGERARRFWTREMRAGQAELLSSMLENEKAALASADKIITDA